MKQEKLTLRPHIHGISFLRCLGDSFFQNISRIHFVRCSVRTIDITDQTGHFALLRSPRKNLKSPGIRIQIHIRVFLTGKSLYRGNVKHAAVIQRFFQLAYCYSHIFHHPENVCKLQADEGYIFLLHKLQDILSCVIMHK